MSQNNNTENQLNEDNYRGLQPFLDFTKRGFPTFISPCQHAVHENMHKQFSWFKTFRQRSARAKSSSTILQLIEAVFFFENATQWVKCWYCGTTSFNRWRCWSDPWVEHAKRAPTCEFLLQKKGVEFARLITS